jgi:predicted RND superfamily exporter protein
MTEAADKLHQPKRFISAFDEKVTAYTEWVIRFRWVLIIASLLSVIGTGYGAQFIGFSTSYRVFFSEENPQLNAFEALQNIYTKEDNITFVIKPKSGDIFTPKHLQAVQKLTESGWKTPYATRVDSITNFQHSFAEGDDLTVQDLVGKNLELTPNALAAIRKVALSEPLLLNKTISPDGTTTGVNVSINLPEKSMEESPAVNNFARELAAQMRAENPDLHIALTGTAALNHAFAEASQNDMQSLIPLMYVALLIIMALLLRSISGTIATVLVIGFSAAAAMGLAGWAGVLLTPPSATAPTIILTVAVADSIHILITMLREMRLGATKREAIIESMRINFTPVLLTSVTTIIGFMSLNFSDSPPFRDLGNITAVGVAAAWFYSIVFLPALMAVLPVIVKVRPESKTTGMLGLAEFVIRRKTPLFWGTTALVIGLGIAVPRIELNDKFVEYFEPSVQFRADTDFAMENLSGIYQLDFSIPAQSEGGISEPEFLANVDAFKAWFHKHPDVVHVQSLTDIMKRLNKNMHADEESFYKLPDVRDLAAQYLLLFEMSLPYGLDLNNQINVQKSAVRVIVTLDNISTRSARKLAADAKNWLTANFPGTEKADATGPFVMFSYISQRNIEGMLGGTALALFLISGLLVLALKSMKMGVISLVPNLVPAIMAFGVWSIFVGQVGLAASVVAATSLGVIVDATVHFLTKYMRARRQRGNNTADAIRYAFSTVGTALWVTSLILIAGFAVLALSTFKINQEMGLLMAITLACALIADFLLLPALLLLADKKSLSETNEPSTDPQVAPAE